LLLESAEDLDRAVVCGRIMFAELVHPVVGTLGQLADDNAVRAICPLPFEVADHDRAGAAANSPDAQW
jgi:hypothetical protein